MSKQTGLPNHGFSMPLGSPVPEKIQVRQSNESDEEPNLTVVILKLEPAAYGRCSLCHKRSLLPFCLEYLNGEGEMVLWGDVCQECAETTTERRKVE